MIPAVVFNQVELRVPCSLCEVLDDITGSLSQQKEGKQGGVRAAGACARLGELQEVPKTHRGIL